MHRRSVFVSYATADESARQDIERELASADVRAMSVPAAIDHGSEWQSEVASMLATADCLVVLVGSETHKSEPVAWEIDRARDEGLPVMGLRLSRHAQPPRGLCPSELVENASESVAAQVGQMSYLDRLANRIRYRLDPQAVPEGPVDELFRIYAVLALAKGYAVSREDVHNAWSAWMIGVDRSHPSLVPFSELDDDTAAQDEPYVAAIRAALTRREVIDEVG